MVIISDISFEKFMLALYLAYAIAASGNIIVDIVIANKTSNIFAFFNINKPQTNPGVIINRVLKIVVYSEIAGNWIAVMMLNITEEILS